MRSQLFNRVDLQEIEEKAPIIKQQKDDYERLQNQVELMTSQLNTTLSHSEKCRVSADEAERKSGYFLRENHRLTQSCTDLSQQVENIYLYFAIIC